MTKLQFANQFCDNLFANAEVDISNKKVIKDYINTNINNKQIAKYIYYKYLSSLYEICYNNVEEDCKDLFNEKVI